VPGEVYHLKKYSAIDAVCKTPCKFTNRGKAKDEKKKGEGCKLKLIDK
jgi:hypothetical protein